MDRGDLPTSDLQPARCGFILDVGGTGVLQSKGGKRRLVRLTAWSLVIAAAVAAVEVLPYVIVIALEHWVPHRVTRSATIGLLQAVRLAYLLAVAATPLLIAISAARVAHARKRGRFSPDGWRGLALGVSLAAGTLGLEAGSGLWDAWSHRLPELPTRFPPEPANEVNIVVIGGSSARGVPYEEWLSLGAIVAWQLEKLQPERTFRLHVLAQPGHTLEQAIYQLMTLKVRPNLLIIYAGQNEFQSRFGWSRSVRHYRDEEPPRATTALLALASRISALCGLIEETIETQQLDAGPPAHATRGLVDWPVCTLAERARLKVDFARRLDQLVTYSTRTGALPLLIVPPSNDGGFPPNRSYLRPETSRADRSAFAARFREARALEGSNPRAAERGYRRMLAEQPVFAEAHYRLGQLRGSAGAWAEARAEYRKARDLDGLPLRFPSDFQEIYQAVAVRHNAILVDGPAVLRRVSRHGILDDSLFHDEQHPAFLGYVALAQEALCKLQERGAFGLRSATPAPRIDPKECADHFGLNPAAWAKVCEGCAATTRWFAFLHHDAAGILAKADRYARAAQEIAAGRAPESVGVPGIGTEPAAERTKDPRSDIPVTFFARHME